MKGGALELRAPEMAGGNIPRGSQRRRRTEQLFQWYREKGIADIGREETDCQDANGPYIGKGPVGEIELETAGTNIARRLQTAGFIREHFGENVPILIHDLEYSWFDLEATRFANPEGQAEAFLEFWEA